MSGEWDLTPELGSQLRDRLLARSETGSIFDDLTLEQLQASLSGCRTTVSDQSWAQILATLVAVKKQGFDYVGDLRELEPENAGQFRNVGTRRIAFLRALLG